METKRSATTATILLLTGALLIVPTVSQSETLIPDKGVYDDAIAEQAWSTRDTYSPYAKQAYSTQVFWGDTHLHTAVSVDATIFGATLGLEDAYRFGPGRGSARVLGAADQAQSTARFPGGGRSCRSAWNNG